MATQPEESEVVAIEKAKVLEMRREERQALTAIPASDLATSPLRTSFMPQTMGEAIQLATIMARSTFVPNHCRGSEGNCLAIIMQAGRWGMDPFAVANKAYFVKEGSPPGFEAQLIAAVVNSSGALSGRLRVEFEGEGNALRCTVRGFLRADPNDEKVRTQSIARITTQNSPLWKSDPQQQLGYYTQRAWARLFCPEVLLGVYTPDEIEIDPERARVVSPSRPSRSAPQLTDDSPLTAKDIGKYDDTLGRKVTVDDVEQVDVETGEVFATDPQTGMTEVSEEEARALDAGAPTGDHREGRATQDTGVANNGDEEAEQGEAEAAAQTVADSGAVAEDDGQQDDGDSITVQKAKAKAQEIRNGIAAAKTLDILAATERSYMAHCITFPQWVSDELEAALLAKKKALRA